MALKIDKYIIYITLKQGIDIAQLKGNKNVLITFITCIWESIIKSFTRESSIEIDSGSQS